MHGPLCSHCIHCGMALADKPCPSSLGQVLRALKNVLIPKGLSVGREIFLEMKGLLSFSTLYPQAMLALSEALKVSKTFLGHKGTGCPWTCVVRNTFSLRAAGGKLK